MLSERELSAAIGSTAYGPDGQRIGTVEHFFTDDRTGAPTWVAISTGLFGTRHSVVPATEATFDDGRLQLPVDREAVRSAPAVDGEHLAPDDEDLLRRHYAGDRDAAAGATGTEAADARSGAGPAAGVPAGGVAPVGAVVPGASLAGAAAVAPPLGAPVQEYAAPADPPAGRAAVEDAAPSTTGTTGATPADGAMTRSEEQVHVGTERVAATRVRLVKYVVTEEVQLTVPVRREEIRVEHVPLDAPDTGDEETLLAADGGSGAAPAGGELPGEIVLHAERPVVSVEVVPVERVRLRTEVVGGHEEVTEQVQREQIAVDQS